ncbi:hypothetical protein A2U01_0011615, partial [Trifolium medium]|nr:hypothetical protein [Trifolium medium]
VVMVDAKPSKEVKPKVVVNSNKLPKVEAKPVIKQPKVDAKSVKEHAKVNAPNVDCCIQITTQRKFDAQDEMISWVCDVAYKLGG